MSDFLKKINQIMDTNTNTITGIVTEALPNTMFRVRVPKQQKKNANEVAEPIIVEIKEEGETPETINPIIIKEETHETIIAYLGGKMKYNRIRVIVGDIVEMVTDEYGGKARITRRKPQNSH